MDISLIAYSLVVLVTVTTPGPTVLLALRNGSRFGLPMAGAGIIGAGLSDLVLITAAALGLGAVLAASAFWFAVVKWLGVAYLAWIGLQMYRSAGKNGDCPEGQAATRRARSAARILRKSFLVAVTNPKGYLFFAAFLPQFVDITEPLIGQYARLALVFLMIDLAVMSAYAALGANAMRFLRKRGAIWLEPCSGIALLILAGGLALYKRA